MRLKNEEDNISMKLYIIFIVFFLLVFNTGCINDSNNKKDNFILIETVTYQYNELISGNFTDGHSNWDGFMFYAINAENMTIFTNVESNENEFKLVYCYSKYESGSITSGSIGRFEYNDSLPFYKEIRIYVTEYNFSFSLTVTEKNEVYINESYLLQPDTRINSVHCL